MHTGNSGIWPVRPFLHQILQAIRYLQICYPQKITKQVTAHTVYCPTACRGTILHCCNKCCKNCNKLQFFQPKESISKAAWQVMQVYFWSIIVFYICNKITYHVMIRRTKAPMKPMQAHDRLRRPGGIRPDCLFVDFNAIVAAKKCKMLLKGVQLTAKSATFISL